MAKGRKTGGRQPGTPNRATIEARMAVAAFVDRNVERMQGWLDEIAAEKGAQAAWDAFTEVLEYHVPKQSRVEHKVPDGAAVMSGTVFFVSGEKEGK